MHPEYFRRQSPLWKWVRDPIRNLNTCSFSFLVSDKTRKPGMSEERRGRNTERHEFWHKHPAGEKAGIHDFRRSQVKRERRDSHSHTPIKQLSQALTHILSIRGIRKLAR